MTKGVPFSLPYRTFKAKCKMGLKYNWKRKCRSSKCLISFKGRYSCM